MKEAVLILNVMIWMTLQVIAQKSEVFTEKGKAISGYDPVAYFTARKPVEGNKDFTYSWNGEVWYFSNRENLAAFKASPEKFTPQYGGYCAYGMAKGYKAKTEPDAWTILNGKLYLNYNKSVEETWKKDQQAYIEKANKNWPGVKDKE